MLRRTDRANDMELISQNEWTYKIAALVVLTIFYGIYFTKMLLQKRRGIRTHQIGRRKEKGIHTVETLMSIATLAVVAAQLMSIVFDFGYLPPSARFAGFCIGALGDLIFLISVIKMKDSWRAGIPDKDKTELVTDGIYKYSRNPAFLAFDFMYIGVLFLYFNPISAAFTLFAIIALHLQILQEEKYLAATFGDRYLEYKKHTFRYLGRR